MGERPLKLLVDTHILLWRLTDDVSLSQEQANALDRAAASSEPVGLAAISLWEIAMLAARGRIELRGSPDALLEELENHPDWVILPLTSRIALESTRLGPSFHRDPADQIIAATARVHGFRLLTADDRVRASGVVSVL